MMKRLIALTLICLLLCGCVPQQNAEETPPVETEPPQIPTEPGGSYDPNSLAEAQSGGAVRAYPLRIANPYAMAVMGDEVLIFSGEDTTTLTRLSGENLYVTASAQTEYRISPEDPSVQVTEKGVAYYDRASGEMILLDQRLSQVGSIAVPEDVVGEPVLTADRKSLFYCTATGVRVLDLESGISRLLKEMAYPEQSIQSVLLDNTVVRCRIRDERGEYRALFISVENGQTLWEGSDTVQVSTCGNAFYADIPGGVMREFVYGTVGVTPQMLIPEAYRAAGHFLPERNALVSFAEDEEAGNVTLDYYDLATGQRMAQVTLEDCGVPLLTTARADTQQVYLLCHRVSDGSMVLYRWDIGAAPLDDETVYAGSYYTLEAPDAEGFAQCQALADDIYARYGVRVLFGEPAVAAEPWDYDLTAEYHVPVLRQTLMNLMELLEYYPADFLSLAAEGGENGCITLCLVRRIAPSVESTGTEDAAGLHFWHDGDMYLALAVGGDLQRSLYHEMYFAFETRLLSNSNACYEWEKLNPSGFAYTYDAAAAAELEASPYLQDKERCFIHSGGMISPSDDRAWIMEYAMMPGNESFFASEPMQAKLHTLCTGIREAFGEERSEENFPWEQYLQTPLT